MSDLGVRHAEIESFLRRRVKSVDQVINCLVGEGDQILVGLPFSVSSLSSICLGSKNAHMENEVSYREMLICIVIYI